MTKPLQKTFTKKDLNQKKNKKSKKQLKQHYFLHNPTLFKVLLQRCHFLTATSYLVAKPTIVLLKMVRLFAVSVPIA